MSSLSRSPRPEPVEWPVPILCAGGYRPGEKEALERSRKAQRPKAKPVPEPKPASPPKREAACASCGKPLPSAYLRPSRKRNGPLRCQPCHLKAISPIGTAAVVSRPAEVRSASAKMAAAARSPEAVERIKQGRRDALNEKCVRCGEPAPIVLRDGKKKGTWFCERHGPTPFRTDGGPDEGADAWREFNERIDRASLRPGFDGVLAEHRVTLREAFGPARHAEVVRARHACWALLRSRQWSYPEIARLWGRDHTTVLAAMRNAPDPVLVEAAAMRTELAVLRARLAVLEQVAVEQSSPAPLFIPDKPGAFVRIG